MISADVKADVKELVAVSCKFFKAAKLEICIFYLILRGNLSSLRLFVENRAGFSKLILSDVR